MPITLQHFINNPHTVRFVSVLARGVPPAIGYPACDAIGKWAATRRRSAVTRAVRLNQWAVRGANLDRGRLDQAVRETLQNNVRDLYELYQHLERPDAIWRRICLNPLAKEPIGRPEFAGRGLVTAGIHLSSFDSVLTAIDRPVSDARLRPRFFGHPAPLPTHHIFPAMKARVPLVVMAVVRQKDGTFNVLGSEPMEMLRDPNHETEILQNAERVLLQAESFIRLAPQQWNVPLPIWPELLKSVPI